MEVARDLAKAMEARGEGVVLDQFGNAANPLAHFNVRGQPAWAWLGARGACAER
jgi:cysteine synthase B